MKIVVTGATGFVGGYVMQQLLATGNHIIVAARHQPANTDWEKAGVEFKQLDFDRLDNSINYFEYFGQPDIVIHLAWQGLPNYTQLFHFEKNLSAHYNFLKNLVANGLQNLTVTGTCFEYGMRQGELKEDMPSQPDNAYALAKFTLYCFLVELQKQHPFHLSWLRLFYMYGKGQSDKSLYTQLTKALERGDDSFNMSGGEQVRDFLPVETVAATILKTALLQANTGIINCCSGQPIQVKDLVTNYLIEHQQNIKLNFGFYPYAAYEPMAFWGSTEKWDKLMNHPVEKKPNLTV